MEETDNDLIMVLKIHDVKHVDIGKKGKKKQMYLVEWQGFPDEKDYTWEPHKNLKDCIVYQEYKKKSNKRKREDQGILVREIFKKTKRDTLSNEERHDLIRNQNYKCNLCLTPFGSSFFEIDHIIPLEQGGSNDMVNLQGLCSGCHIFKTSVLDRGVIARLLQAKLQNKDISVSRTDILRECQIFYFNKNKNSKPFQEEEMLNFCITTADIYREMCKKEIKKLNLEINISNTDNTDNTSNTDNIYKDENKEGSKEGSKVNEGNEVDEIKVNEVIEIKDKIEIKVNEVIDEQKECQPPQPSKLLYKSEYLNNLVSIIKKLFLLDIKNNVITMKNFTLGITLNKKEKGKTSFKKINTINTDDIYMKLNDFFRKIHKENLDNIDKNIGPVTIYYNKISN